MTEKEFIKYWEKKNIERVEFEFDCGGDSMNDTTITIFNNDDEEIEDKVIEEYIDNEIYRKIEFYEVSDGVYMGENGIVTIILSEKGDELIYSKDATKEYIRPYTGETLVKLTKKEIEFIQTYVSDINGEHLDFNVNYKVDFILTDEHEKLLSSINDKIYKVSNDFFPDDFEGEFEGTMLYDTKKVDSWDETIIDDKINIIGNKLVIYVTKRGCTYEDSE